MRLNLPKVAELPQPPDRIEPSQPRDLTAYAPPSRRHLSAAAAEAAQRWDELEGELRHTKVLAQNLEAQVKTLEAAGALLREEMADVKGENERLVRENVTMHTRMRAAADVLVGLFKNEQDAQPKDAQVVDAMAAIEAELLPDTQPEEDRRGPSIP